jgi:toxin ParE1/3/4
MLRNKAALLAERPGMDRSCPELAAELHNFPVGDYLIFYRPTEDGIEVIRVLYAARDIATLL